MTKIRLSAAAKRDVREAKEWYVGRMPGLDLEFRDELEVALDRIRAFPESYQVVHEDVRPSSIMPATLATGNGVDDESILRRRTPSSPTRI